jgi:GNAT superfamily N-acetyltransferase
LDALVAPPRAAKLPAFYALGALVAVSDPDVRHQAAEGLAHALRDHGNGFLALVDALADAPRREILPLPRSGRRAAAVRAIAAADPLAAYRLAHALQSRSPTAMLDALTDAPFDVLARIWRLLPKALQQSILGDRDTLIHGVAALERANDLAYVLRAWNEDDPTVLLALRLLIDDDARRQGRGVAILAQQPDMAASLLPLLREDLRALLVRNPRIVVAGADLPPPSASVRRRRR